MEHFIIIRFSTIFSSSPEFDAKKNQLFNTDRLDFRFYLFETFCLHSIVNQTLIDFKVIIIFDKNLPTIYKNKLTLLTQNYDFIFLHQWDITDDLYNCLWIKKYLNNKNTNHILTTRLDDDDMINLNINAQLKRYINKFNCINKLIYFKGGYFLNHYSKDKMDLVPIHYSNLAVFLTKIHTINQSNVYNHVHHQNDLVKRVIKFNHAFIVLNHTFENDNRLHRFKKKKGTIVTIPQIYDIIKK